MAPQGLNFRYVSLAAAIAHEEGFFVTKTLSYRNSNPGNIENADRSFKVFVSIEYGWKALYYDIAANAGKTLAAFLGKYAPPTENNTAEYLAVVSRLSGIQPDEIL